MSKGGIFMSKNEAVALRLLKDFGRGVFSRFQVDKLWSCSERVILRRVKRLRDYGSEGIKQGNYANILVNRTESSKREKMPELAKTLYFDFTLLLQMDDIRHCWNGKDEWCLIAMIDDATSEIPAAQFFKGETILGCKCVLRAVIEAKGIPQMICTDQEGWAEVGPKRSGFSQFVRACTELGIRPITTSSAEAKGRIEKAWRTTQDRLIPELRFAGVTTMLNSNRYLDQVYIPRVLAYPKYSRSKRFELHETISLIIFSPAVLRETAELKGKYRL